MRRALWAVLALLFITGESPAQTKINLTNQAKGPAVINQGADGNVAISSSRATDTSCTGYFARMFKVDGTTALAQFDCEGNLTTKSLTVNSLTSTDPGTVTLGSATSTAASYVSIPGGDAATNAEAPYIKLVPSPNTSGSPSYIFPSSTAGRLCMDTAVPAADCTTAKLLAGVETTDTLKNKTLDNSNKFSGYTDLATIAAPSNPSSGYVRFYGSSSTGDLACLDSGGGDCLPTGGSVSWSGLSAPTAAVSMVSDGTSETATFDFQSAFTTGSQFVVKQSTGNPMGGSLAKFECADADIVDCLWVTNTAATTSGKVTFHTGPTIASFVAGAQTLLNNGDVIFGTLNSSHVDSVVVINESDNATTLPNLVGGVANAFETHTSGTRGASYGWNGETYHTAGGDTTFAAGLGGYAEMSGTGGTITDMTAIYAFPNARTAGTVTRNYGLYIGNQTAGTTNYSIYTAGNNLSVISGKQDRKTNTTVDDDDCTGEQGWWWYDTTDSQFEFCNANSGVPATLGGGSTYWETLTNSGDTATSYTSNNTAETVTFDFQAAYTTGCLFCVKTTTGTPSGGTLLDVNAHDADVTPFKVTGSGSTSFTFSPTTGDVTFTAGTTNAGFKFTPNGTGDILPGVTGVDLGSATLPFADFYISGTSGTPATNNFKFTGASTSGTRTMTLPDAAGVIPQALSCTNQFATALNVSTGAWTCTSPTLAGAQFANQGTTAQVLVGNASGNPSWASVSSATLAAANKTFSKDIVILSPTTSLTNYAQLYFGQAVTITRVACSVAAATSVTIQLDERAEATPNTAGTDVMTGTLACDTDSQTTTSFSNAGIAARVPLNLQITATSGTPGAVRVHIEYTVD